MDNRNIENRVDRLISADRVNKQTRKVYKSGLIQKLSPQGDRLYAVIRRPSTYTKDESGELIKEYGQYFGNEIGVPVESLTLSEVLIETDIDLSLVSCELEHYIGKEVQVEMVNGYPIKAYIQSPNKRARRINKVEIQIARLKSDDNSINKESMKYLLSKGYSTKEIDATINETIESTSGLRILTYGKSTWQSGDTHSSLNVNSKEQADAGIVSELPLSPNTTKAGFCFKANKALTAR